MNLDSIGRAKDESTLSIKNPSNGKVVKNDDGTDMEVTVYGEYSADWKNALYDRTKARIEKSKETGQTSMSFEDMEDENFEVTCRCTKSWNLTDKDGPIELTPENVRRIYTDYPWVYQQVRAHMENSSNFLDPSAET